MSLVIDQAGGNEGQGTGVDKVAAAPERQRPYPYTCLNCGAQNAGKIEDGCTNCGAGRGGVQKGPEPAVDFTCQACRGGGKVERRCATCGGTGQINAVVEGQPPVACLTCGGGGAVAMDCARCQGTGIDPTPQPKEKLKEPLMETTQPTAALPTLDDNAPPPKPTRRYLVIEVSGETAMVDVLMKLEGRTYQQVDFCRRAVEIAASPTTDRLFNK